MKHWDLIGYILAEICSQSIFQNKVVDLNKISDFASNYFLEETNEFGEIDIDETIKIRLEIMLKIMLKKGNIKIKTTDIPLKVYQKIFLQQKLDHQIF